jgi:hypothetical protein
MDRAVKKFLRQIQTVVLIFGLLPSAFGAEVIISDLRDAVTRLQAMKTLFAEVDQKIKRVHEQHAANIKPLQQQLELLRNKPSTDQAKAQADRQQKASLLLKIAQFNSNAASEQQKIGAANELAIRKIDAVVAVVERELQAERRAATILRAQDALYFDAQCVCNVTEEIYKRVNARLPKVSL